MKRNHRMRKDLSGKPDWLVKRKCPKKAAFLSGKRIMPKGITGKEKLGDLVESAFLAYNAARLREGCELFTQKMLEPDVTVGTSLAGALTPAGLGCSCVIPLVKAGFVDWIVATGANLYHDLHFAFNFPVHAGSHLLDDTELRKNDVVRIYDVLLGYSDCLRARPSCITTSGATPPSGSGRPA
jgi:deoxyhypusine synthase